MDSKHIQLKQIIEESVTYGLQHCEPPITAAIIRQIEETGQLAKFIEALIVSVRSASEWGSMMFNTTLGSEFAAPKMTPAELDAISFSAVLSAIGDIVELEGATALAQATLSKWLDLSEFQPQSVEASIYETAREMGLPMRSARSIEVLDEATQLLGHFFEI